MQDSLYKVATGVVTTENRKTPQKVLTHGRSMDNLIQELGGKIDKHVNQYPGFRYIPAIELYVSMSVSHKNKSWNECKEYVSTHQGTTLLTPLQFWCFYDYVAKHEPDALEDMFASADSDEWLDATAKKTGSGKARLYAKGEQMHAPTKRGMCFNRSDVSKLGFPHKKARRGDWRFAAPSTKGNYVLVRELVADGNTFAFRYNADFADEAIGMRIAFQPGFYPDDLD